MRTRTSADDPKRTLTAPLAAVPDARYCVRTQRMIYAPKPLLLPALDGRADTATMFHDATGQAHETLELGGDQE